MPRPLSILRAAAALAAATALTAAPAAGQALDEVPFWQASAGWWLADNTYFSPSLDYNIRAYNSLVHLEVRADRVVETEVKFYPPGKMAMQAGKGRTAEGEGVEAITVTIFAGGDPSGSVRQIAVEPVTFAAGTQTTIKVLGRDTAEKSTRSPNEPIDHYRLVMTMPTPDRRYHVNYGLVSTPADGEIGALRGFSTSFMRRIDTADFERHRAELRQRFNVKVLINTGPDGKARASRL